MTRETCKGVIAAGHPRTVEAAAQILQAGGNAFDAVVAAHLAACVAEPVLASLGGGGYLLARQGQQARIYDFFVQTPKRRRPPESLDFYPIQADFGTAKQEFHIGLGAVATPGVVRGLWRMQKSLGRMSMTEVAQPAIQLARDGVVVNAFQAYVFDIVAPIYRARPETFAAYRSPTRPDRLVQEGDLLIQPQLADSLEALAREGDTLFYEGDIARRIVELCRQGGLLEQDDLRDYALERRRPLRLTYRNATILTNPPPSSGGILIAFALKLLEPFQLSRADFGSPAHLKHLAGVQAVTQNARRELDLDETHAGGTPGILAPEMLGHYREKLRLHPLCRRGTTHISIMDRDGNIASLTTSNGEGCGWLIPDTGIMLNNMLGEADLNPHGFYRWPCDTRMTSMMAPTIAQLPHQTVALGSGGSNRLRTAILQVLINLIDFGMPLSEAVSAPRLHFEDDVINLEDGFEETVVAQLASYYPIKRWPGRNLFFGGVHAVASKADRFDATGDPRRGGASQIV